MLYTPKVSVVVPVYKVEKYLHQCVDSILQQSLHDIEVILVDDGSPDSCPQICDEYARKDPRVKVIHQQNGGLGKAYNAGIAAAQGKYIGLVESDDWIEPDMYSTLYSLAETYGPDILKCDFFHYNSFKNPADKPYGHGTASPQNIYPENKVFNIEQAPLMLAYHSAVWAGLYKSSFIKQLAFKTDQGAAYVDFPFSFEALLKAKGIMLTYKRLYHYRIEEGQNSSTLKPGRGAFKMLDQILYVKNFLVQNGLLNKYAEEFHYHAAKCYSTFFRCYIEEKYKKEFYKQIRKICKGLPKNFSYRYFEDKFRPFTEAVVRNDKAYIFNRKPKRPKQYLVQFLACFIPIKTWRKKFRQKFS